MLRDLDPSIKVLVVGATGLLGSVVVPYLRSLNYNVVTVGNKNLNCDEHCDLLSAKQVEQLLLKTAPGVVINFAALTNVDKCEQSPHEAYLLNVKAVQNLAAGMQCLQDPYLIQISTDQVYDSLVPSYEDDVRITNVYALTKYAGEMAAMTVPCTVLRTNFFGHGTMTHRRSFSDWVTERLHMDTTTTVFDDVIVNPLNMTTVAAMINQVIVSREISGARGIFNMGARDAMSKADLAFAVASVLGLSSKNLVRGRISDAKLAAYRPKNMWTNCTRFETTFGVTLPALKDEVEKLA
jgi:dTDP-4-dehydrorhamnose reductase